MVSATVAGYRHMLCRFGPPGEYMGDLDSDAVECCQASGALYPARTDDLGYGPTYYDKGLIHAIEIRPGGDRGTGPAAVEETAAAIIAAFNAPNPANRYTTFRVQINGGGFRNASFAIYDLSGRKIRVFEAPVRNGVAEVVWDLKTSEGHSVAPGVYLWQVKAGAATVVEKCVVN